MKNVYNLSLLTASLFLMSACASMQDKTQCEPKAAVSSETHPAEAYCAEHTHFENLRI